MNASTHFGEFSLLEKNRNRIIHDLCRYHKIKNYPIILVFDAYKSGNVHETAQGIGNIEVIYTKLGETADEKIIKLAEEYREKALIITADKEIIKKTEKLGASSLLSEKFAGKVLQTISMESDPFEKIDDDDEPQLNTKKKGNAQRLSKKARARRHKIKKL